MAKTMFDYINSSTELIEENLIVIGDIEDKYGENDELIASWGFMFMCGVNIRKELEK